MTHMSLAETFLRGTNNVKNSPEHQSPQHGGGVVLFVCMLLFFVAVFVCFFIFLFVCSFLIVSPSLGEQSLSF